MMNNTNSGLNEREARENILRLVEEYCQKYHAAPVYKEGDRIPYAARVYDSEEMCNLVSEDKSGIFLHGGWETGRKPIFRTALSDE